MVPMIVVAGVIIGMITIVPAAMADREDDDDNKEWKSCKKWFFEAFRDFRKHGYITPESRTLVNQCLSDGHQSPWKLPKGELEDVPPPALSGLTVEFVISEAEIPYGAEIIESKVFPCPSGTIIIDTPTTEQDVNAQLSLDIMTDRATLMVRSFNTGNAGTLVLVTPCLGIIEN